MGKPLILYGQPNLLNHSFEVDADEADPSSWDITSSVNGLNDVDDAQFHSAGIAAPSVQSLRQNVSIAGAGNKAVAAQRIQADDLLAILKAGNLEFGVTAMVRLGTPGVDNNVYLDLKQYDGSNLTVGEGTEKTAPTSRSFIVGLGPEWLMYVTAQTIHADTDRMEVHLRYETDTVNDYDASGHVWWDRVFMGGLVDFHKGLNRYKSTGNTGYNVNQGDGVAEIVKVNKSSSDLDIDITNVVENSVLDYHLKGFQKLIGSDTPGQCAFWADRDLFTNGERHYQFLIPDPKTPKIEYPPGFNRRNYKYKFLAYTEYTD